MRFTRKQSVFWVTALLLLYICTFLYLYFADFSTRDIQIGHSLLGIPADKVVHFCMMLPFSIIVWLFVRVAFNPQVKRAYMLLTITILGLMIGGICELIQEFLTSYRAGDIYDWLADNLGVLAGSALLVASGTQLEKWLSKSINYGTDKR